MSIFEGHVPSGNWVTVGYRFPPSPRYILGGGRETGIEMRPEVKALLGKVPGAAFWEAIERPEWNEARGKGIAWR